MTWLPEWDEAARALAAEILGEPVPQFVTAGWDGGTQSWRFTDQKQRYSAMRDHGRTRTFAVDARRRGRVGELVAERGLAPEVKALALELLPYGSTVHRFGWDAEAKIRAGTLSEAKLEEENRRVRERFLA